ncbi:sialate O-acetylesterase [Hydrocarboniphaga sp.]|uniref:sialate O-acetylesterase n=1 Tax=Hydrocarboniphaga sp. TaxID=2033016 RepID=UPI003D147282
MNRELPVFIRSLPLVLAGWVFAPLIPAHATELPLLFSDGAVLQRDQPLPVWGWAKPGSQITVTFDGGTAKTHASSSGEWRVELPVHAAGGPYELSVAERGGETLRVRDVLVGDVWLASGQSNMEFPVAKAQNARAEIARAGDAGIRHFKVPRSWSDKPEPRLAGGYWRAASPGNAGDFSAVGYFFARELRTRDSRVPIGIVDSTWGGSAIEAWMSAGMLGADATVAAEKIRAKGAAAAQAATQTRARIAAWNTAPPSPEAWAAAALEESGWAGISVPAQWETQGYAGMDGVAWYRKSFELSAPETKGELTLGLGQIDDSDRVWVNGQPVGGMDASWNVPRVYRVPAAALRVGRNTIAVQVTDLGAGGGMAGSAEQLYLRAAGGPLRSLAGEWKFRTADVRLSSTQDDINQVDTALYNAMIRPLQPYALRGTIWYQGEANAYPGAAFRYRDLFASMIRGWRADWSAPQLPFLWVQLAGFHSGGDTAGESPWAVLRESQSAALALPATAQALAIDIGESNDIHPRNKQEVGRRLALAARAVAYGESLVHSGPVFRAATFDDTKARITFDLQHSALAVRGGGRAVHGFELSGADGHFHPAQALIDGGAVVVSSEAVVQPQALRYAWNDDPKQADLINRDGLPASPFRAERTRATLPQQTKQETR